MMTDKNIAIAKEYLEGKEKGEKVSYNTLARKYEKSSKWISDIVRNYKLLKMADGRE